MAYVLILMMMGVFGFHVDSCISRFIVLTTVAIIKDVAMFSDGKLRCAAYLLLVDKWLQQG